MKFYIRSLLTILLISIAGQVAAEAQYETLATFNAQTPPGNIAVGPDGRIFLSIHEFYGQPIKAIELLEDGLNKPYPDKHWAFKPRKGSIRGLYGVLGLNVDTQGILWMLDTSGEDRAGRLVGWDTKKEEFHKIIYLAAPVIGESAFLNDLAIDRENNKIYIADTATPETAAMIVVDLNTNQVRRILEGSEYTVPEDIDMVIDGRVVTLGGSPARIGINPITIDPQNKYVYWGAMSGTSIYRAPTSILSDFSLSNEEIEKSVERYGDKPISDGITIDGAGNVYVTSITDDSIGVIKPDGTYETLIQDDTLSWPDGLAFGPDNKVYATINELHRSPVLNNGENAAQGEFKVIRFDALTPGKQGR